MSFLKKPVCVWLWLVFTACGAFADEKQFADYNCAITIPDGWHVMTNAPQQPGMLGAYTSATGNRIMFLLIIDKKPAGPLDDRFITGYEQGVQESSGDERLSGKFIEVAGIKSYERVGRLDVHGKHLSSLTRLIPGDVRFYNVQGLRFDGDATADPELQQAIGSFRFLHQPEPPSTADATAYRIGQMTGMFIVIIAAVAVAVFLARRKKTSPPTG